jgi:hypothetical protein
MLTPRRSRLVKILALGAILVLGALVTGCSREKDRNTRGVSPATGPAITRAGVNPPEGNSFTSYISGSGFQKGDKVLVNGTTELDTVFGGPELVTFRGGVQLLEARTTLTLVVLRPGTNLRSNSVDAKIPSASPKG